MVCTRKLDTRLGDSDTGIAGNTFQTYELEVPLIEGSAHIIECAAGHAGTAAADHQRAGAIHGNVLTYRRAGSNAADHGGWLAVGK